MRQVSTSSGRNGSDRAMDWVEPSRHMIELSGYRIVKGERPPEI